MRAYIDLHLGILLGHADDVDAARRSLGDAIATATRLRLPNLRRVGLAQLGSVLALAGRSRGAEPYVRRVLDEARQDHAQLLAVGSRDVVDVRRGVLISKETSGRSGGA